MENIATRASSGQVAAESSPGKLQQIEDGKINDVMLRAKEDKEELQMTLRMHKAVWRSHLILALLFLSAMQQIQQHVNWQKATSWDPSGTSG